MKELADAVIHWIAYRRCLKVDSYLTEDLFREPIIEYLRAEGWRDETELDYGRICNRIQTGKCFADYYLSKEDDRLLLETKFFKTSSSKTVFNDFVRLALPRNKAVRTSELIIWAASSPPWGPYQLLRSMQEDETVTLDPLGSILSGKGKVFELKDNKEEFLRLMSYDEPISTIEIRCAQRSRSRHYGAILLAVTSR